MIFFVLSYICTTQSYYFNVLSVPFDGGANIRGSSLGPPLIIDKLQTKNIPFQAKTLSTKNLNVLHKNVYTNTYESLQINQKTIILGGDHSISIGSVAAVHDFYSSMNQQMGIVWFDAHADFNTVETSPSKNIHGMPVAVLCGDTLPSLQFGSNLAYSQIAYYGMRDVDSMEMHRVSSKQMEVLSNIDDFLKWQQKFDSLHVSFDLDCLDPSVAPGVSTPVEGGKTLEDCFLLLKELRKTNKVNSMDVVEYNPLNDVQNKTLDAIPLLISELFDV